MTKNDKLILVDFDRTLFETSKFLTSWWGWLAKQYNLDTTKEIGRIEEYFNYVGDWRNYNFLQHIEDLRLGEDIETIMARALTDLVDEQFLFADAQAILDLYTRRQVEIITFGNKPYQSYKMSFCSELDGWTRHIVGEEKGDYIARKFGSQPIILIDDKDLASKLPSNVEFIRLERKQEASIVRRDGHVSINSLNYVEELI